MSSDSISLRRNTIHVMDRSPALASPPTDVEDQSIDMRGPGIFLGGQSRDRCVLVLDMCGLSMSVEDDSIDR